MVLTIQFVPYHEISDLSSERRINKLMDLVKKDKVVLMQGRLRPSEEAWLIQKAMELYTKTFKGIELCTIQPKARDERLWNTLRNLLVKVLIGDSREGVTIIGPATIIKEIKQNPDKIELLTTLK